MSQAASPSAWGTTDTVRESTSGETVHQERDPAAAVPRSVSERWWLAGIVSLAALMYGWEAAHTSYHGFYAVAVRSMTTGWRAFLFGALDPNASITIDKIPGFLWPQAVSAQIFGFHPWSLALPQVIEGVVTVLALNSAVRRWIGPTAGLLAAGIFALTPVAASLFGKVLEDAALTCMLVLAAAAWQRAVQTGRLRWLLLCGVWVGLGFQAKMMQAWAVLPAFAIAYFIAAPTPRWLTRLWHTLAAGAVCVAVSLSWVIIATLTPAADRPYIDGSTNNSAIAMVFGYNGLARFSSVGVSAAGTGSVAASQGGNWGGNSSGWLKLFEHNLASQVGWLYPVAAAGILLGLWRTRSRKRSGDNSTLPANTATALTPTTHRADQAASDPIAATALTPSNRRTDQAASSLVATHGIALTPSALRTDQVRAGTLMWTIWLLMTGLALSAGSVPHSTYLVALAPPLAALSAYALVRTVAMYRNADTKLERLALPALTAVTLAWAVHLSAAFPKFVPGIALPLAALAITVVVVAVVARRVGGTRSSFTAWSAALCCTLMLAVPALWSLSVFDSNYAGSSGNANAGGYTGGFTRFAKDFTASAQQHSRHGARAGLGSAGGGFNPFNPPTTLNAAESRLLSYLTDHRDGARYLVATESWAAASPYILDDEASVLPMGGFSGNADFPQPQQFTTMLNSGELHYVLLTGRGMHFGGAAGHAGAHAGGGPVAGASAGQPQSTDLTKIAADVTKNCQLVPASAYGAVPQETGPLYHCA